jgi:hypothetical protein
MATSLVSSSTTFLNLDAAFASLASKANTKITKNPGQTTAVASSLQSKLNTALGKFESFKTKLLLDKKAKLKIGTEIFLAPAGLGINSLQAKYQNAVITNAPNALDVLATLRGGSISSLAYSTINLSETAANDGALATAAGGSTIVITLTGDSFAGSIGAELGSISNLPAGLTASLVKTSSTLATLTISGKATANTAADSVANVVVSFSADNFSSGTLVGKTGTIQDLILTFFDVQAQLSGTSLILSGSISSSVTVDLVQEKILVNGVENPLSSGSISSATAADASGVTSSITGASQPVVNFLGDSAANTYIASALGGSIQGGAGNDILFMGNGVDRVVFESTAALNGTDTITSFRLGTGGDVLNFSAFLNATKTTSVATVIQSISTAAAAIDNGQIYVVSGAINAATDLVALFGAGKAFANPTSAGKYVFITADVVGNASVWFVTNDFAGDPLAIAEAEVAQVATLVGINNLGLDNNKFVAGNFA